MAILDHIWESGLDAFGGNASIAEAAAYMFMFKTTDEREVCDLINQMGEDAGEELRTFVHRIGRLVKAWSVLREIRNIAELSQVAKGKLVTGVGLLPAQNSYSKSYFSEDERVYTVGMRSVHAQGGEDDVRMVQDGVLALAAIRWYIVRVRDLLAKVGDDDPERDWFWSTFGEYHHTDLVDARNRLVHQFDNLTPTALHTEIDRAVQWLADLAAKIRRTQMSVPDTTGASSAVYEISTLKEISEIDALAELGMEEGRDVSAIDSLVHIGPEPDLSKPHHLIFQFVSFDSSTNRMTFHNFEASEIKLLGRY